MPPADAPPSPADAWDRFERFLAEHLPVLAADLAAGTSEAGLDAVAEHVGAASPDPFAALYRRHDGQRSPAPGLFFGLRFLPSSEAARERDRWASLLHDDPALATDIEVTAVPPRAVAPVYASPAWVPFASDGAGNHLAIDLGPGPEGTPGHVISFGADEATRYVLALSAAHFLDWCARQCDGGRAEVAPDPDAPGGLGLRLAGGQTLLDAVPSLFGPR
ncbi:SMI1/KNR4 family protein [Rubrivirga sp.]|uniref:SMI1/KNR4 family protein n=1 Tax=Rubrivirga sp. TaxID=1885344 RepID=UPI003B52D6AA